MHWPKSKYGDFLFEVLLLPPLSPGWVLWPRLIRSRPRTLGVGGKKKKQHSNRGYPDILLRYPKDAERHEGTAWGNSPASPPANLPGEAEDHRSAFVLSRLPVRPALKMPGKVCSGCAEIFLQKCIAGSDRSRGRNVSQHWLAQMVALKKWYLVISVRVTWGKRRSKINDVRSPSISSGSHYNLLLPIEMWIEFYWFHSNHHGEKLM